MYKLQEILYTFCCFFLAHCHRKVITYLLHSQESSIKRSARYYCNCSNMNNIMSLSNDSEQNLSFSLNRTDLGKL